MCEIICPECNGVLERDEICNCDHCDYYICKDCKKRILYAAKLIKKIKDLDKILKELVSLKKEGDGLKMNKQEQLDNKNSN